MGKARILLSGNRNIQYYVDAVNGVGGIADAKYLPEIDTGYDGLILCGGNDVDPAYYGEEMNGSVDIDSARDKVEFALLKAYIEAGKPVMGVCRGYQLINIYFGGTMYQHIPETDLHRSGTDFYAVHDVTAEKDSVLARLHGETFSVNSAHHQVLKTMGKGLRPTAYWQQYVEAYEHNELPIFGVQWHPERMCFSQQREDTVDGSKLFTYFMEMCKNRKE